MRLWQWIALFFTLWISGCSNFIIEQPDNPRFRPAEPVQTKFSKANNGSLYSEQTSIVLFETQRARHVGDILTVNLEESHNGNKSTSSNTKKEEEVEVTNPTIFGQPSKLGRYSLSSSLVGERGFKGTGDAAQTSTLNGKISVSVYDVLPNGYLKIRGEKWIRINQGDEFVRLTGIVRPNDIAPDNTISSYKIANARISYSGTGQVSDATKQGWLARFFNSGFFLF